MQRIAEIVVRDKLHVISDELYDLRANGVCSTEPPSLGAMTVVQHGVTHRLHDYVFTCDGTSKRYNLQGEDGYTKAGFGTTGDTRWMQSMKTELAEKFVAYGRLSMNGPDADKNMLLTGYMLEHTPDAYFQENAQLYRRNKKALESLIQKARSTYHLSSDDLFIKPAPDSSYLMLLEVSPELAKKAGIRNAAELNEYLIMYSGVTAQSETGSGSNALGLRVNPSTLISNSQLPADRGREMLEDAIDRIGHTLQNIKKGIAPNYSALKPIMDNQINKYFSEQEALAYGADKDHIRQQRTYATR